MKLNTLGWAVSLVLLSACDQSTQSKQTEELDKHKAEARAMSISTSARQLSNAISLYRMKHDGHYPSGINQADQDSEQQSLLDANILSEASIGWTLSEQQLRYTPVKRVTCLALQSYSNFIKCVAVDKDKTRFDAMFDITQ